MSDIVTYAHCADCKDSSEVDIMPNGKMRLYGFALRHASHNLITIGRGVSEQYLVGGPHGEQPKFQKRVLSSHKHRQ